MVICIYVNLFEANKQPETRQGYRGKFYQGDLKMVGSIGKGLNYKTVIKVWSREGFTPLTKRPGSYCDLLAEKEIECKEPCEARQAAIDLIDITFHAATGHFYMVDHPNQNLKSGWVKL